MSYEHFGNLLRELRESRNITREQLAQNICTPKQIYRIEKGEYEPSLYLLNQLSIKFNMDLNEYFKMFFTSNTIVGFEGIKNLNNAINKSDYPLLQALINKFECLNEFQKGENLQHILYAKALCASLLQNDYNLSLEYCIKGIKEENPTFTINSIKDNTYSNVGLTLLNCISLNYLALNEINTGMKILFDLLYVLEHFILESPYPMYQATQFSKVIYQGTLYNISIHLYKNGDAQKAMFYVNKGIDFSVKENNIRYLPELIQLKLKLLYQEQNYEEAKEHYNRLMYLYKIMNQTDRLKEFEESVQEEYPEIFK